MQIPRRGPRRRSVLFVLVLLLTALVVVSTFSAGQGKTLNPRNDNRDPRNTAPKAGMGYGEIQGANPANDCWAHHKGEGMRDAVIVYPILPRQLKVNEPADIPVQIVNPWKQDVRKMQLFVSLGDNATQILTVEALASSVAAKQDAYYQRYAVVGPSAEDPTGQQARKNVSIPLEVPAGASAITAYIELKPRGQAPLPPQVSGGQDMYDVRFRTPVDSVRGGAHFTPGGPEPQNRTVLSRHYAAQLNTNGTHYVEVDHAQGYALETDIFLNATIVMGRAGGGGGEKTYQIKIPEGATILDGGEPLTATVRVTPFATGTQTLEFHVRAENYYKHQLAVTPNEDFYNRYQTLDEGEDLIVGNSITPKRFATVGTTFIPSEFEAVGATRSEDQWQFVLAETSGFAAAALLLPSLLLGGTYGKASRRLLNTILGGAKRRVMYHNLSSLALSLVAFVHLILFVYELRYTILMGVMWGGLAALSLLVLGLTGYYQVPLIQRHGYKWWRYTHLTFGLLVVLFLAYHMIADGPDFFFIKEQIPKWINDINLAGK